MAKTRTDRPRPVHVAVRLFDWSAWCRQVILGVQQFTHERPDWRLYVDVGPAGSGRVLRHVEAWDGIISSVFSNVPAYRKLLRPGSPPVVAITAAMPHALAAVPAVRVDDAKVAQTIGAHLMAGGFRRLAYWAMPSRNVNDQRAAGVTAFAAAHGLPCDLFRLPDASVAAQDRSLVAAIRRIEKPVGIVTWNMDLARRLVDACQAAAVDVPADVAVVAWDDDPMLAETLEPTISAAVLPAERLGYEAAVLLAELIAARAAGRAPTAAAARPPMLVQPSGVLHVRRSSDVSTLADRDVHLAAQYIREHGTDPLRVDGVAAAVQVSRRKLEQDFRRVTGRTLHEAILATRLDRAKQLLVDTGWPLERVARSSGLGSRKTLYRVFDRAERMTPAAYRARFGVR